MKIMVKKANEKKQNSLLNMLNIISGWIVIISGVLLLFDNILGFGIALEEVGWFIVFTAIIGGISLIFLGIYILRFEKWAVTLSGILGIVSLINTRLVVGFVGGRFIGFLLGIPTYILIINWIFFKSK